MGGRHGHEEGHLAHLEFADPVRNPNAVQLPAFELFRDGGGDAGEDFVGTRVAAVFDAVDGAATVVVAHHAGEGHHRAGPILRDGGLGRGRFQGQLGHGRLYDFSHATRVARKAMMAQIPGSPNTPPLRSAGPAGPLTVGEYLAEVLADVPALPPRHLPLAECGGLVLAEDAAALLPVPPFTNSAMDGFAVRAADVSDVAAEKPGDSNENGAGSVGGDRNGAGSVELPVSADIPAGAAPGPLAPGTAARIMTGAPLPDGADAVVPVEETDSAPGPRPCPPTVRVPASVRAGDHVRPVGEDVVPGDPVLHAGEALTAAALAAAAGVGHGELAVHPRPRVAVLATGAELVDPGIVPGPGRIPDSNTILLSALAEGWGAEVTVVRVGGDTADELADAFSRASGTADVIVTSGGISAGAFDPVKSLAAEGRANVAFRKLRQQPGGPQAHGRVGDAIMLGLPGNPVSVFVSALFYLRPLLARLAGHRDVGKHGVGTHRDDTHDDRTREDRTRGGGTHGDEKHEVAGLPTFGATAGAEFKARRGKTRFVPAQVRDGTALPVHELGLGSHLIASLHSADALLIVPEAGDGLGPDIITPGTALQAIDLATALRPHRPAIRRHQRKDNQ